MLRVARTLLPIAVLLSAFVPAKARAAEPFTQGRTGLAVTGRYGFPLGKNVSENPWSAGLGMTYGLTLYGGLYMGLAAESFAFDKGIERFGTKDETIIRGRLGGVWFELGKDWGIVKPLVVRGTVGIGPGWGRIRHCSIEEQTDGTSARACSDEDDLRAVVHANVSLLARVTRRLFVVGKGEWVYDTGFDEQTTGAVVALGAGYNF